MGVIHRDLKPSNALIDAQGNLFLTDFGIAKILASASPRLTQTDAIMGTPAYISPEQAQATTVDQRSDIYSLGIILYEMVTGRVPYTADTPLAVILKHVTHPLPLPSSIKSDIPEAIEQVILKALAKDPGDRFDTVADFLKAWKRALDIKDSPPRRANASMVVSSPVPAAIPTQGKSDSVPTKLSKSGISTRWLVGCLAGGCLLLTVAGVAFVGSNWRNLPFLNQGGENSVLPVSGEAATEDFQIDIGDEIKDGEPDSGAGLIEAPGAKDVYTFNADPGQKIYVHVIELPETTDTINFYLTDEL